MKKILFACLFILCMLPLYSFDIVKNGEGKATVVMSSDMTGAEINASNEFIDYIEKISGVKLPVSQTPTQGNNIYFGQTENVKNLLPGFDFDTLKSDGILIKSQNDSLIFSGDRPRGTLYAVYTFLEENLGCGFFTANEERIPQKKNISANINKVYVPPFMSRESFFKVNLQQSDYKFFVKNKLNGNFNNIPDEWGGHISLIGWCHTIPMWLPAKNYPNHPEWFALVDGKRDIDRSDANICMTNKEAIDELTKSVLTQIGESKETLIISVSQADTYRYCTCDDCKKLCEEYGNSGALLTVVNHVAREVKKKNPNAYVETLAYQWTRQAPKNIKPEDNVIIRLCDIECDFNSPLNSKTNKDFYKDYKDWLTFTDSVYIWDYVVNYSNSHPVFTDFHVLQDNIKLFRDNHGVAVFEEGDDFNWDTALISLKAYLLGKLMWNPDADQNKIIKEYCDFYFGNGGDGVIEYLNILTTAAKREAPVLKCFNPGNLFLKTDDYMKGFKALYGALDKVGNNTKYRDRVLVQLYSLQFSLWQAPQQVQKEVRATGILGIYDTREKFLKMYIPFSFAHDNSYGQYTVHINNSKLYDL